MFLGVEQTEGALYFSIYLAHRVTKYSIVENSSGQKLDISGDKAQKSRAVIREIDCD